MVQKILVSTSSFAKTSDEAVEMLRKSKYEIIYSIFIPEQATNA